MESPRDLVPSFHLFPRLPYELRLYIIEEWLRSEVDTKEYRVKLPLRDEFSSLWPATFRKPRSHRHRLAEYAATINWQWNSVIEKHTFHSLSLRIPDFGRTTALDNRERRRRSMDPRLFDNANAMDDLEHNCVADRISAVSELHLSISLWKVDSGHTASPVDARTTAAFDAGNNNTDDEPDRMTLHTERAAKSASEQVLRILERFQDSKLKLLYLESTPKELRMAELGLRGPPSLHLSQSTFAMTCKLEELYLTHIVDVPYFLKESWGAKGNTQQSSPAWPNMRILVVTGHSDLDVSKDAAFAAELHDSVTQALPQMPKITRLDINVVFDFYVNGRCYEDSVIVYMEIPPRDDRSALRDGWLFLQGPKPQPETVDKWQETARSQWHCKLCPLVGKP